MSFLMGIDLGTSSVKTVIMALDGTIRGSAQAGYEIQIPRLGYAEQDPDQWWEAAVQTIRKVLSQTGISPAQIAGIGFSGQMHGMVLMDKKGTVLRPAIIWCDQRTTEEVQGMYDTVGKEHIAEITLNPVFTGFQTASLLWVKKHEPHLFERIDKVLLPKDYLRVRLTGEVGTDITDASATLAFDTGNRVWSDELISRIGLKREMYPPVHLPYDLAGTVTAFAANQTGLAQGTPVVFGGGDQPMQAVGNGIVKPGQVSLTIGTGGQVFSVVKEPRYDPALRTHTFCNAVPGTWNIMGATLAAGLSLSWLNQNVLSDLSYPEVNDLAGEVAAGGEGLLFLPYLNGERTPHMDPAARGSFLGLTLKHNKSHLLRAVMEGVVFTLKDSVEILKGLQVPMETFIASGGGARSEVWMQIQADVMNREIYRVEQEEQACAGAAMMAGIGTKLYSSVEEACSVIVKQTKEPVTPIAANVRLYEELYGIYQDAYAQNRTLFHRLGQLQGV